MLTAQADVIPGVGARAERGGARAVVIRPRRGWVAVDWRELVEHRELLMFLVLRDLKVRYKQTVLGVAWAVLQPLLTSVIFTVIFGMMAKMQDQLPPGVAYLPYVFAAQLAWNFFSNSVSQAGLSLVNQQALLTKIYLPRLFVPAAHVVAALVDMGVAALVMAGILVAYKIVPGWGLLALPGLIVLVMAVATGVGLVLAAVTVTYRDFRHLIPFMLQSWMFLSPVVYPLKMADKWPWAKWVLMVNPLTGIIGGFRSAVLNQPWDWPGLGVSAVMSALVLFYGIYYFRRTERRFADVV